MATYPYGMKDLPRVTALPRLGLPRATPINNRTNSLRSKTFTANDTFIVPAGVKMLERMEGRGANGTAGSYAPGTVRVLSCVPLATTNPSGFLESVDANYAAAGSGAQSDAAGSGERVVEFRRETYSVGTDDLSTGSFSTTTRVVNGTGSLSFGESGGNITNARASNIYVDYTIDMSTGGSTGTAATGFGKTFNGGTPSSVVPSITVYEKVPVTPLAIYPIVVPAGGYITITYF